MLAVRGCRIMGVRRGRIAEMRVRFPPAPVFALKAMGGIYKELEVKIKNLCLLKLFCFESNSGYAVNGAAIRNIVLMSCFIAFLLHIDLKRLWQSILSLPHIYGELTDIGRSCRSLRHSSKCRPVIHASKELRLPAGSVPPTDLAGSNTLMQNASPLLFRRDKSRGQAPMDGLDKK